jgi:RND family efflux transporter MFP subunit
VNQITTDDRIKGDVMEDDSTGSSGRKFPLILRIVLPVILLAVGLGALILLMETGPTAVRKPKPRHARLVEVVPVQFETHDVSIQVMGTVKAAKQINLHPRVSGNIVSVDSDFVPGGYFAEGEIMLKVDSTDYSLAVLQRKAALTKAEANLDIEKGSQSVAEREYELLGKQASETERDLILRKPQLDIARAEVDSARAALGAARLDLERTTVRTPFNAIIGSINVNLGTKVDGSTRLATLMGTDEYWVEVSIPVNQLKWISIPDSLNIEGSEARIFNESAWGKDISRFGRIIRLAGDLEPEGRMARLLIRVSDPLGIQNPDDKKPALLIGSYVRVEIEGSRLENMAVVDRAVLRDGDHLWIMTDKKTLEIRPVDIEYRSREDIVIADGVHEGEWIVISDLSSPVEGMSLRTAEMSAEDPS